MSDMKNLLEKMDAMSAAERKPTGPKWPGYLKGTDSAKKSRSRMVGDGGAAESVEESQNLLKELTQVINENPVRRDLFQEWVEFKEGFTDTVKSTADKIVSAGSATRDALSGVIDSMPSIPRPFDEIEVAKDIKKGQAAYPSPKNDGRKTDKKVQEDNGWGQETINVQMQHPRGIPKSALDYNDPDVQFFHKYKDGREKEVPKGSPDYNEYWRKVTGREDPITQELVRGIQNPRKPGPEYKVLDPDSIQDIKIPGPNKGQYKSPMDRKYMSDEPITEYGAPGSGISSEPGAAEDKAAKDQMRAGKQQIKDQVTGLVAQLQGARAELAGLNKQFPQGANPVEKAMSLQQMSGQKIGIKKNIENLSAQIAALRQQAI